MIPPNFHVDSAKVVPINTNKINDKTSFLESAQNHQCPCPLCSIDFFFLRNAIPMMSGLMSETNFTFFLEKSWFTELYDLIKLGSIWKIIKTNIIEEYKTFSRAYNIPEKYVRQIERRWDFSYSNTPALYFSLSFGILIILPLKWSHARCDALQSAKFTQAYHGKKWNPLRRERRKLARKPTNKIDFTASWCECWKENSIIPRLVFHK